MDTNSRKYQEEIFTPKAEAIFLITLEALQLAKKRYRGEDISRGLEMYLKKWPAGVEEKVVLPADVGDMRERLNEIKFGKDGLLDFARLWAKALEEFKYGTQIDEALSKPLASKYAELTDQLIEYYCGRGWESQTQPSMKLSTSIYGELKSISGQYDKVFLIVIDASSLVDWLLIKSSLLDELASSNISLETEDFRIAVIPTLTPVATACLYSGYLPADIGICGWSYVNASKRQINLNILDEDRQLREDIEDNAQAIAEDFKGLDTKRHFTWIARATWKDRQGAYLTGLFKRLSSKMRIKTTRSTKPKKMLAEVNDLLRTEDFETKVVVVYLSDLDEYAHPAVKITESAKAYYDVEMEVVTNYILKAIIERAEEKSERYAVVLTADHGKFTECDRDILGKGIDFAWNSLKSRLITGLNERFAPIVGAVKPEITAKTYIHWMQPAHEDGIRQFLQEELKGSKDILFFVGKNEVSQIILGRPRLSSLMPNVVLISKYNFTTTGWASHGGVSLSEMLIPFVKFEVGEG